MMCLLAERVATPPLVVCNQLPSGGCCSCSFLQYEEQELVMKKRFVCRALSVAALTCGLTAGTSVVRAHDHDQDQDKHQRDPYIAETSPKPVKAPKHEDFGMPKGHITIVGCFFRETDADGDHAKYLLADAKMGPATPVANQSCSPTGS